jgi:hypothetical protein
MDVAAVRWATLLGVFALYLWPRYLFLSVGGKGVSGFTLAAILLFLLSVVLVVLRAGYRRAFVSAVRHRFLVLALFAALFAWRLVCDLGGETPSDSLQSTALDFLYLGSWLVTGTVLCADSRTRRSIPYVVVVCALVCALAGFIEQRMGTPLSATLGAGDLQAGDKYELGRIGSALTRGAEVRIRSLFSHPLVYGQVVASMTPAALHLLLQRTGWRRWLGAAGGVAILYSIHLSNARSPLIVAVFAAAIYCLLFFFDVRRRSRLVALMTFALAMVVAAPVAVTALTDLTTGRTSEEAISSGARDQQMARGAAALQGRLLTGYGDGNSEVYAGIRTMDGNLSVDNYYLTRAVDSGIIGAGLFALLIAAVLGFGARTTARIDDGVGRSLAAMFTSTVVGLGIGLTILSIVDTLAILYFMSGCMLAMTYEVFRAPRRLTYTPPTGTRDLRVMLR